MFCAGTRETGTKLSEFCGHALLALEVLIHPRVLPMSDQLSSINEYKVPSNKLHDTTYPSGGRQFSRYQPNEPESEDDDLNENWPGNDDEMGQHDAHNSNKPSQTAENADKLPSISHDKAGPKDTIMANCDDHMAVVESPISVELGSLDQKTQVLDSEAGKGLASTSEQHVSGNTDDGSITIMERISAMLSSAEKSRGSTLESDDEESIPDIVDGDPDSD